jgi:pimeloyl-ACP methyl ester carboxylesterase
MTWRSVALLALTACALVATKRAATEGRTAGGIAYDVRGAGPTVVLIHGGVLDRRMWDHEAEALAPHFRVVRYDLRGMGKSADIAAPFSSSDDLAAVLDVVSAPRAHLVGLSLGSRVALDFALTHPDRVDRLVLAGPFPSGAVSTERPPYMDSLVAAARRGDVDRAAEILADSPVMEVPPRRIVWMRGIVLDNAKLFRQSPTAERPLAPPALARLAEVHAPTLIIVGQRDARDILHAADTLYAGIRGAQRVKVANAPHLVNVWEPDLFTWAVTQFLSGRPIRR